MTRALIVPGVLVVLVAVMVGRRFLKNRFWETYELGLKMGEARATHGQAYFDVLLREAGVDPDRLPAQHRYRKDSP